MFENDESAKDDSEGEVTELNKLKKKLKNLEESKKAVETEYFKCEKELKAKTEEIAILKTEVKDLKTIINLEEHLKKDDNGKTYSEKVSNNDEKQNANKSKTQTSMPRFEKSRIRKEIEYNCQQCYFQATSEVELKNHIYHKHTAPTESSKQGVIYCNTCGEQFSEKWNLMEHRKDKHVSTVAFCRN